jgi:NADH:ubiquinone reductase (H+-translocating)
VHPEQTTVVIAGAGYAGLHVALRLEATRAHNRPKVILVDRHPYHQVTTELPRVASGTRLASAVRIPVDQRLAKRTRFVQAEVLGFDFRAQHLLTSSGPRPYTRLVLTLGSQPNDHGIPGLTGHALNLYSSRDAEHVWAAVQSAVELAVAEPDAGRRRDRLTVLVGGGGPTGVEIAGELAETLPELARSRGLPADLPRVVLIEARPTILPGFSASVVARARRILGDLGVAVRTEAAIAEATALGCRLRDGELVRGGVLVWTGGLRAPDVVARSSLSLTREGRVRVDPYLRALDHPEIFVAGDLAAAMDPGSGRLLPPLAQIALDEAESVVRNLRAELAGRPLRPFAFHNKGVVPSVGPRRGLAEVAGLVVAGRLTHALKDLIEWEYRESVQHLHGWNPV